VDECKPLQLGEYHRLQYLVMLQPSLLPVGRLLRADPMRLLRLANARYIEPVAEWDPAGVCARGLNASPHAGDSDKGESEAKSVWSTNCLPTWPSDELHPVWRSEAGGLFRTKTRLTFNRRKIRHV